MTDAVDGALALLAQYRALLTEYEVDFDDLDEESLALPGEAQSGTCDGLLLVEDVETGEAVHGDSARLVLCQIVYLLPLEPVTELRRPALYELLAHLAGEVSIGAFELDPELDRVRYRAYLLLPAQGRHEPAQLMAPLLEGLNTIDAWFGALHRVLVDGEDPGHAYAETVLAHARDDGRTLTEAERGRLLALIQAASARYQAAGTQVKLDLLAEMVRQLTRR